MDAMNAMNGMNGMDGYHYSSVKEKKALGAVFPEGFPLLVGQVVHVDCGNDKSLVPQALHSVAPLAQVISHILVWVPGVGVVAGL